MHDDAAEMTKALRDSLKQALEHQREIDARQVKINAKLDALLERTSAALIAHDAQLAQALREAEAEDLRRRGSM